MRPGVIVALLALLGAGCRHQPRDEDGGSGDSRSDVGDSDLVSFFDALSEAGHDLKACPVTCALGCNESLGRCKRLKPANIGPTPFFDAVTTSITFSSATATINTDTGEIKDGPTSILSGWTNANGTYFQRVAQAAGYPMVAVLGLRSLVIPASVTVTVEGKSALAVYLTESLSIDGKLVASAKGNASGAGGYSGGIQSGAPGTGCLEGGQGSGGSGGGSGEGDSGGGGGGFGTMGGAGGNSTFPPNPMGAVAGSANGTAELAPLRGGCGGGAGGSATAAGALGGGGGGAIQLSVNGSLTISGIIHVPGAGGGGANADTNGGGGGGGSGGAILLEAVTAKITRLLAANGGGGGGGAAGPGKAGQPGQDGMASTQPAPGAPNNGSYGGPGGTGGAVNAPAQSAMPFNGNAGGGGGAVGRIRINAVNLMGAANTSPAPSTSSVVATW